ncbi:MAG: DAK2 domain-containing protein [Clostridia bacterium]|nr:DAK2 domain-containing protein [Clostridia bacterium]
MINGAVFRDAIISASNNIMNHRQEVDSLNVFPVPDGDTGTNMCMTMDSAARELQLLPDDVTVETVAKTTSSAMLRGARGNSGVILSLIFRGVSKGLKGKETMEARDLLIALSYGVESAYKAVMKPTEGTILTVVRLAARDGAAYGTENKEADIVDIWQAVCDGAEAALATTPDLLPVLKKAGVVDSGGQGLVYAFHGMLSVFKGEGIIPNEANGDASAKKDEMSEEELVEKYDYKLEYVIRRNDSKDKDGLKAYLKSIGGNVSVREKDGVMTVKLATDVPGPAMVETMKFGSLIGCKIENLAILREEEKKAEINAKANEALEPVEPVNDYGFVAVAAGEGLSAMFSELGADVVVSGGQTMNPSTEDILNAVEATPAKTVFVLPNNKNIIMAAEQAAPLSTRKVIVLPTRTVPQGMTAMMNFDPDASVDDNHLAMAKAIENVGTAQVTFAARDSLIDGKSVKQGQILGMENGSITTIEDDVVTAAFKVTKNLCNKNTEIVTIFYGEDATEEEANQLLEMLQKKFSNIDISILPGGQPVYYYIISVE